MLNNIKRTIKGIKLQYRLVKGMKEDNNNNKFYTSEINEQGFIQRNNTRTLLNNNACVAGVTVVLMGTQYIPCIYTDALFNEMSKEGQEFIIQHELGHFKYQLNDLLTGTGRTLDNEIEADLNAVDVLGYEQTIKGLEELKNVVDAVTFGKNEYGINEIEKRIEYVKNLANA